MARILIVDDSPTETYRFREILERNGHGVIEASNGADGVVMARAELPDLVLMDVVMPDTNGYQATRKISTDPETKDIPIIIVSTKNQPTDRVWGMRQGAKEYLCKPVDEAALIAAIASVLKQ